MSQPTAGDEPGASEAAAAVDRDVGAGGDGRVDDVEDGVQRGGVAGHVDVADREAHDLHAAPSLGVEVRDLEREQLGVLDQRHEEADAKDVDQTIDVGREVASPGAPVDAMATLSGRKGEAYGARTWGQVGGVGDDDDVDGSVIEVR